MNQIPYKYLGQDGSFTDEDGSSNWHALIEAKNLFSFLSEIFPAPLQLGNRFVPRTARLPGFPALSARRVAFSHQDGNMPIDPWLADGGAPVGTYDAIIKVTIEFGGSPKSNDTNEPRDFLDISADTAGEFISTESPGSSWQPREGGNDDSKDVPEAGKRPTHDDPDKIEVNKQAGESTILIVPTTQWTIKWSQIPYDFYEKVMIYRMRACMGRVNSQPFGVLFNAAPETVLFNGHTLEQKYSWRAGGVTKSPVTVAMKLIEKRVVYKGIIRGHNDVWRPGKGWERLLHDGENPLYSSLNMNLLFQL